MLNKEYLLAHVLIHSFAILSITASPNCTEIEDKAQSGDSGKRKPNIWNVFYWRFKNGIK